MGRQKWPSRLDRSKAAQWKVWGWGTAIAARFLLSAAEERAGPSPATLLTMTGSRNETSSGCSTHGADTRWPYRQTLNVSDSQPHTHFGSVVGNASNGSCTSPLAVLMQTDWISS